MRTSSMFAVVALIGGMLIPSCAIADQTVSDGEVKLLASACERVPPFNFRVVLRQHPAWSEANVELQDQRMWSFVCTIVIHTDHDAIIEMSKVHRAAKTRNLIRREVARRSFRFMYDLVDAAWTEEEKNSKSLPSLLVTPRGYTVPPPSR